MPDFILSILHLIVKLLFQIFYIFFLVLCKADVVKTPNTDFSVKWKQKSATESLFAIVYLSGKQWQKYTEPPLRQN